MRASVSQFSAAAVDWRGGTVAGVTGAVGRYLQVLGGVDLSCDPPDPEDADNWRSPGARSRAARTPNANRGEGSGPGSHRRARRRVLPCHSADPRLRSPVRLV